MISPFCIGLAILQTLIQQRTEEEAQGAQGLRQEPGEGHQEHVDKRHGPQVLPELRRLYAKEDSVGY